MDVKIGCETLPYSELPLERALEGIARAGYRHVCFGTTHEKVPALDVNWTEAQTLALKQRTEDYGLLPVMAFMPSEGPTGPGGVDLWKKRLDQGKLLGLDCLLAWGPWEYESWPGKKHSWNVWQQICGEWLLAMEKVAAHAEEIEMMIVLKPHTGLTAYGNVLRQTIERIGSAFVRACYDGGNVHFYEGLDPALDIKDCAEYVCALCVKDHTGPRAHPVFPPPGTGDVDHRAMLEALKPYGFRGPVVVERFEGPFKKTEMLPELIDALAAQARVYLEKIVAEI